MKALAIAIVLAATSTASAHPCGHGFVFAKEGPFCPQEGSGYWAPSLHVDFIAVTRQIVLPADSVNTSKLPPGTIDAPGAAFRVHTGFFGFHVGADVVVSWFDANRGIASGDVMAASTQLDPAGRAVEANFIGGYRRSTGPFLYGVEAAFGLRNMWRRGHQDDEFTAQGVIDVRAQAGVWLSPFVSLGAQVGHSVLRAEERSAMLMLGLSLFPFDGLR